MFVASAADLLCTNVCSILFFTLRPDYSHASLFFPPSLSLPQTLSSIFEAVVPIFERLVSFLESRLHVGDRVFPIQLYVNAYRNPTEHTARHGE